MMEFVVVKFTDENAPGIVSSNWLNRRKGTCWYPDIRSEMKKTKLLLKRAAPSSSWLECPVIVLKEFASYQTAKAYLSEIEDNANSERLSKSVRKRKKSSICLSDEESCSEEDESKRKKSKKHPAFNFHPSFFTEPSSTSKLPQNQYQVTFSLPVPPTTRIDPMETPGHSQDSDFEISDNRTASSNQGYLNPANEQGIISDIEQLKTNQTNICNMLAELLNKVKKLESKMDTLLINSRRSASSNVPIHDDEEDMDLISSLPVDVDDFTKLNERIAKNPSFKQHLAQILKTSGAKNAKALTSNILRKLITDDVGEKFSLTGKTMAGKNGVTKLPFEKTAVYKLLLEVCFTRFPECKENIVRETISDWLMQSKFRKSRREKKMTSSQPNITYLQTVKDENSHSDDE